MSAPDAMRASDMVSPPNSEKKRTVLPRFRRSTSPPRCLLQQRDTSLLEDLWRYRYLTTSQLELLRGCDPDPDLRFVSRLTLTRRLKLLFHSRYVRRLARPSVCGMMEPVYLLDREGARVLSLRHGEVSVRAPSQLPKLAALEHALAINQFRVSLVAASVQTEATFALREWRNGSEAKFTVTLADTKKPAASRKVGLIPDGAFALKTKNLKLFYFLEVDLGTEVSRVLAEKCRAYYAFWQSGGFGERYGLPRNVGFRVLFVAPTEKRAATILQAVQRLEVGHNLFRVALLDEIRPESMAGPIWRNAAQPEQKSQLTGP